MQPPDPRTHISQQLSTLRQERWCQGRSTKTPTSWGSRLADSACCLLWGPYVSSIGPSERTPYDFVALLEMLPNFISDRGIQDKQVLGGRPTLCRLIIPCVKVDVRCLLTNVCPAQKQIKPLTFLWIKYVQYLILRLEIIYCYEN